MTTPTTTSAKPTRPLCSRCLRPLRSCLCAWIRPTDNATPVLVLQHPAEAGHAKGSVRLLQLSLQRCQCTVGEVLEPKLLADALWPGTALLYPATPGVTAQPAMAAPVEPTGPIGRLLVLDGTWRQSRQLLRLNPALQALPRLALQAPPPSLYAARKAQRPDQRSTLEATCLALGQLEAQAARYAPLLQAFAGWVGTLQRSPLKA
jgi:DTW domain-containing protein